MGARIEGLGYYSTHADHRVARVVTRPRKEDQMSFCSLIRISLIGCSLWACVNQYQSPGGEVEETSAEPSGTPEVPSEESSSEGSSSSSASSSKSDEAQSAPSEAFGTCDDRSCTYTTDCCKGYECGFDPGRSKVMRYCLPS